jgi:hypothetical protein
MKSMCEAFDFANIATIHGDYNLSIEIYKAIIQEGFKSREIISNLGTCYLLKALSMMDTVDVNFVLPLQIDMETRMRQGNERGINSNEEIEEGIKNSIELFKQAITIDSEYGIAYLNLSIAHWLNKEIKDSEYFLDKAKSKIQKSQENKIKVFEAIIKMHSLDNEVKKEGLTLLNKLDKDGYALAKANLKIINNSKTANKTSVPDWIIEIAKTKLPDNFQDSNNILDSTFHKDKYRKLVCKEVKGDITYRKWKYNYEPSYIALQYKFQKTVNKQINENEKNSLFLYSQSLFETNNCTYMRFGDVILIIDLENNIKYQIIKSL